MRAKKHNAEVPYSDIVTVYADEAGGVAVPTWKLDTRTGWIEVFAGEYSAMARPDDTKEVLRTLLEEYYPECVDKVDIFSDTSYHSALNQGEAEKIGKYGMEDYTLDFSAYELADEMRLLFPIKTNHPKMFGKEIGTISLYVWHYIVLDWRPADTELRSMRERILSKMSQRNSVMLFVEYNKHYPDGSMVSVYKSEDYPLSQKREAMEDFRRCVEDFKAEGIETVTK